MFSTEFTKAKCLRRVSVAFCTCTNFVMEAIHVKAIDLLLGCSDFCVSRRSSSYR